jgi:hypothetical protein
MFWYIFWIIFMICILCGLGRQYEIEKMNEERYERRLWLRVSVWNTIIHQEPHRW